MDCESVKMKDSSSMNNDDPTLTVEKCRNFQQGGYRKRRGRPVEMSGLNHWDLEPVTCLQSGVVAGDCFLTVQTSFNYQ